MQMVACILKKYLNCRLSNLFMNKKYYTLLSVISLIICSCANDENHLIEEEIVLTDNIEVYNSNLIEDSYVLAVEGGGTEAYLLDKQGHKRYTWQFEDNLGNDLELLPNGQLIGIFKSEAPTITYGGYGGKIKIINSDGSVSWEYEYSSTNYIAHHDVEMLSNGNVLFLVWERISALEAQSAGVNTTVDIFPEALIEVNPSTNQIIWEWHSWDHIVQDINPNALNYGVVSSNPQLININYNIAFTNGDIMHANGIDLDEQRDVIFISVNEFSEIWVIDHSTTTAEASSNSGGNYNKGGNLLYRFGNPEAYNNTFGQRLFYNNHYPNFLENNVQGAGNLLVYVNSFTNTQSIVYELNIPEVFNLQPNINNEPSVVWSFTDENLFFGRLSGAVRLTNGNTLICEGDYGFWEVTSNGDVAWKYAKSDAGDVFWRGYNYNKNSEAINNLGL